MAIISKQGKLFGIINVADLLILVAVVVIAGAVIWQIAGSKVVEVISPQVDVTVEAVIIGAPPAVWHEAERLGMVGDRLVAGNEYTNVVITEMHMEDYIMQNPNSEGQNVNTTDPAKKNIVLTFVGKGSKDAATIKFANQEVRAGRTFILKTQTFESIAVIRTVTIGE